MGNFEKLGILVIIVLIVTIVVLGLWGMTLPLPEEPPPAKELSGVEENPSSEPARSGRQPAPAPQDPPAPWPVDPPQPPSQPEPPGPQLVNEPEPPAPVADSSHTVKNGESLYRIAAQYYGHGKYWREIAKANPDIDPNNITADLVLVIPDPDRVLGRTDLPDPDSPREIAADGRTYVVKRGDSLYAIAQNQLGAGTRWRELHRLNRDVIGPSPDDLQPGMRIQLPR